MQIEVIGPINNAGLHLIKMGQPEQALQCFEYAMNLTDEKDRYHFLGNIAIAYREMRQYDKAIEILKESIKKNKSNWQAMNNLGTCYKDMGKYHLAKHYYKKAHAINPESREVSGNLKIAMFKTGEADKMDHTLAGSIGDSNYLLGLNYVYRLDNGHCFREHEKWGDLIAKNHPMYPNKEKHEGKIRVGYVSSDFRNHSVMFFFLPILENHDGLRFEITCFSNSKISDEVTVKVESLCDNFVDILGMSDEDVCDEIKNRGIDILVDLNGHTADNRLKVFAGKPAPIQVSYIGYPNTTGLSEMDYRITDRFCDPEEMDKFYTETLVRLDGPFICYKPTQLTPIVNEAPAIKNGHITFGCFNNYAKITDGVIDVWCEILKLIPESKLVLKEFIFADKVIKHMMWKRFEKHGIAKDRVHMIEFIKDYMDHLKTYHKVDIALDTFPYNGTTTTCEALWMGVPVICLLGDSHRSRVGASLLNNITPCMTKFIARDVDEYVEKSVHFAQDVGRLNQIRLSLRNDMYNAPLMDAKKHTRAIEAAYTTMVREHIGR